jgi:hypothetical protein
MPPVTDPVRCACPQADARHCADFRSGYDMKYMLDPDLPLESGEECACACHDDTEACDDEGSDEP